VTGLYEWDADGTGTNSFVVPAWYVEHFKRALERDPGDDRLREALGRFSPVPDVPRLFEMPEAALPPACDFHAELLDLTFPVPDPPPRTLVDRMVRLVMERL
jgi:hypothetical protein